jgi:phage FluMu protein Com
MTVCAALKEYRCSFCKKLLCKGLLIEGILEVKCRHCHAVVHIEGHQQESLLCLKSPCPFRVTQS